MGDVDFGKSDFKGAALVVGVVGIAAEIKLAVEDLEPNVGVVNVAFCNGVVRDFDEMKLWRIVGSGATQSEK
jgi:hypothetical protein